MTAFDKAAVFSLYAS